MSRYLAAALLARTSDEGSKLAVMLLALAVASPAIGGYAVACLMAPHVLAAPLMGRWIDRSARPHHVLALATIAFAALVAAGCASLGRLPDLAVMALFLAAGMFGPAITGGLASLVRLLNPEAGLPRAFGLDSLTWNLAGMIGPAVAASIAVTLPREAGYLMAGLAAAAALPLLALRLPAVPARDEDAAPSFLGGLRSIRHDRPLALVTAASSVAQLGLGALAVAVPLRAHALGAPVAAGWWFAALAAGALVGSIGWTIRPARVEHAGRVVMVALVATGVALSLSALVQDPWLIGAGMALAGVANGPQFGALQVVRDRGASDQDRAGVFTLAAGIKVASAAVGTALAGQLAGLPAATLMLGAAVAPLAAGLAGFLLGADRAFAAVSRPGIRR
jgi:MFS family permease